MALWSNHPLIICNEPLVLAPMADLTHRGFRQFLWEKGGCDLFYTEMISATSYVKKGPFESYYDDPFPGVEYTVAQLVGARANLLVESAKILVGKGFRSIDLNGGCSAPAILKKGAGGGLMREKEKFYSLVDSLRSALPDSVALSAKIRLGDSVDRKNLLQTGKSLESSGLDFLTVHPKTIRQKPSRPPHWDLLKELQETLNIPVIANGGISDPGSWKRLKETTAVKAWMIGRSAIQKPWIFQQLKNPGLVKEVDLQKILSRIFTLIREYQPLEFHLSRAQRFSLYFSRNLLFGYRLHFRYVQNCQTMDQVENLYRKYFDKNPEERVKRITAQ